MVGGGEDVTDASIRRPRGKRWKEPITADLDLLDWGPKGSVQATSGDRTVPIDRGIPGELVTASIDMHGRHRRGVVVDVLAPSPARIDGPCPYFHRGCGGCQWQHLTYAVQVEEKRSLLQRELDAHGVRATVDTLHGMSVPWRYRHTAAIALGWEAGFRPRARRGIVQIDDCAIAHPLIGTFAATLNALLVRDALPRYHGKVWLDCTVIGSPDRPALQVVIQGISGLTLDSHPELPDVAETLRHAPGVMSVAFRHKSGTVIPLIGDLIGSIEVDGRPLALPAGAFFQTNLIMLSKLLSRVREAIGPERVRHLADIYGGVGTFGLQLSGRADRVTLIELDPQAVEAARQTCTWWGLSHVSLVSDHAEHALPELPAVDVAIVDPPRSGLGEVVVEALDQNGVPLIIYVSCAPASLARDLALFEARGYTVDVVEAFDFYPHTYHIESLALLRR
jgi:23S rRNA (uracil1939-C5)-methyltransferase